MEMTKNIIFFIVTCFRGYKYSKYSYVSTAILFLYENSFYIFCFHNLANVF